ncbi:hypothetical protein STEG23_037699 [Scotinomys teguina]
MDILKSEILRKRQLVEDRNLLVENKKYFKRSELAKKEEEAYFERCGYKIQPKEDDQKPLTSSNPVLELELAEEKLPMTLSRQEVIRRLRERGEPIRLFGETDYDAFQRLRKIEILTPEVNKGLRNDLKAALDKIDQQYLNEIVGGQEPGEEDTQNDLKVHEENTTIEELEALGESLGKGDDHKDMDIITKFLKFLLGVWAKELNAREDYVKRSVQGKLNSATQKQTESYLRPLFRKLRKRNLPADIKESITDIIKFMLQREYVKANDAYLQMAIGNAPWPIGVTMVGIHARTGREKIFSKHVAHVLNDETQRKYIQLAFFKSTSNEFMRENEGFSEDNQFRVFYNNVTCNVDVVYANLRRAGDPCMPWCRCKGIACVGFPDSSWPGAVMAEGNHQGAIED